MQHQRRNGFPFALGHNEIPVRIGGSERGKDLLILDARVLIAADMRHGVHQVASAAQLRSQQPDVVLGGDAQAGYDPIQQDFFFPAVVDGDRLRPEFVERHLHIGVLQLWRDMSRKADDSMFVLLFEPFEREHIQKLKRFDSDIHITHDGILLPRGISRPRCFLTARRLWERGFSLIKTACLPLGGSLPNRSPSQDGHSALCEALPLQSEIFCKIV